MKKTERLFQIIQILRQRKKVITAATLADLLEVSERTIYRDIAQLIDSGIPIEGEAGVGYILRSGYDLPPLNFNENEIEALVLGARIVSSWADNQLVQAAESVLGKVEAVLPENLKKNLLNSVLFVPPTAFQSEEIMHLLRMAIKESKKISFSYCRKDGVKSNRIVWPLCLAFFPPHWLLAGWCEFRQDYRSFNITAISDLTILDEEFVQQPGRNLDDFLALVQRKR